MHSDSTAAHYSLLDVLQRPQVGALLGQRALELLDVRAVREDGVRRREVVDDEQAQLVLGRLKRLVADRLEDDCLALWSRGVSAAR